MGFFDSARSLASSALTRGGGILRKAGDYAAPVIRRIGQVAGALRPAVSVIGTALAPLTDGASMAAAGAINKGLGYVNQAAQKADPIAARISGFGQKLQGYGEALR
jgi:hypothetical protein